MSIELVKMANILKEFEYCKYKNDQTCYIFETVLNRINDSIIILDTNGKITFWNQAASMLLGLTIDAQDITPDNWTRYLFNENYSPLEIESMPASLTFKFKKEVTKTLRLIYNSIDKIINFKTFPLYNTNEDFIGICCLMNEGI